MFRSMVVMIMFISYLIHLVKMCGPQHNMISIFFLSTMMDGCDEVSQTHAHAHAHPSIARTCSGLTRTRTAALDSCTPHAAALDHFGSPRRELSIL